VLKDTINRQMLMATKETSFLEHFSFETRNPPMLREKSFSVPS